MNNFVSIFEELNSIYDSNETSNKKLDEYYDEEAPLGRGQYQGYDTKSGYLGDPVPQWWLDKGGTAQSWRSRKSSNYRHDYETNDDWRKRRYESLSEEAEDDIIEIADDTEVDNAVAAVDDEPKQVILECDKCGALTISDEADIKVDDETDLVNITTKCKFCEEKEGYKIIGIVAPYEPAAVEDPTEESETDVPETEEPNEEDIISEDLADVVRKTFDKPASIRTQQHWEDELNGECGEISDKRRAHLEKKFIQQRDWEEKHPEKEVK